MSSSECSWLCVARGTSPVAGSCLRSGWCLGLHLRNRKLCETDGNEANRNAHDGAEKNLRTLYPRKLFDRVEVHAFMLLLYLPR